MKRHVHDHSTISGACRCGAVPEPNPHFDVLHPYAGPCAFCGGPDKRHRLADSVVAYARTDGPDSIGDDFPDVTPDMARALLAIVERNGRRHRYRWTP